SSAGYKQKFPFFVDVVKNPITQFISNIFPSTFRARVLLQKIFWVQSQVTDDRVETYAKYFDTPGAHYAISQCALHLIPEDLDIWISKYRNITIPVLLIWGQQDSVISTEVGKRFKNDISMSTLVIIPNTGHVPHEERPLLTSETIQSFLESLE
ncbi:MAG: alpha/beta hydrolase, partial [Nitrosomonas ureae]